MKITTPTHPELCNHCKPLIESSNLEWVKVGGQSVSIPKKPLHWVLRDKYSDDVINANANYSQQLAAKSRELTAVTEQRDTLAEVIEQLKSQLTQTRGAVTISRNGYVPDLEQQRDEARAQLSEIENKIRIELRGHPDSKLWGEAGLIAATMRCVAAMDEVTEQRDEWKAKYIQQNKDLGYELHDPNGTIWSECKRLQTQLTAVTAQRDNVTLRLGETQERMIDAERHQDRLAEVLRELCITLLTDKSPDITDLLNKAGAAMAAVNYSNIGKTKP